MIEDIVAIKEFENYINYKKESTIIDLYVEAKNTQGIIYQDYTNCRFYYEAGYGQQVVEIDWNITDSVMSNLGLHSRYNTRFQNFVFKDNSLIIKSEDMLIHIREKE